MPTDGGSSYMGWLDYYKFIHTPDAKRGAYARKSQAKRRKMQRRVGGGRRRKK